MVDSRSTFHCIPMYPHDIPIFVGKHPWYSHICQIPISFCLNHEISVGSLQIPSDDLRKTSKHPPAGCLCVSAPNGLSCIKRPSKPRAASLKKTQAGQAHKCWRNVNQLRYWANFYLENGGITCSDRQKNEDFIGIYPVKLCNDNIIPSPQPYQCPPKLAPQMSISNTKPGGSVDYKYDRRDHLFMAYVDNQTWSLTGQEFLPWSGNHISMKTKALQWQQLSSIHNMAYYIMYIYIY